MHEPWFPWYFTILYWQNCVQARCHYIKGSTAFKPLKRELNKLTDSNKSPYRVPISRNPRANRENPFGNSTVTMTQRVADNKGICINVSERVGACVLKNTLHTTLFQIWTSNEIRLCIRMIRNSILHFDRKSNLFGDCECNEIHICLNLNLIWWDLRFKIKRFYVRKGIPRRMDCLVNGVVRV